MKRTYTATVAWENGDVEEIDVEAHNRREAMRLVREELERLYQPGGQIKDLS